MPVPDDGFIKKLRNIKHVLDNIGSSKNIVAIDGTTLYMSINAQKCNVSP